MRTRPNGARPQPWRTPLGVLALSFLLPVLAAPSARSEDTTARPDEAFVIPPAPSRADPRLSLDVHAAISTMLNNDSLCPRGGCVMRGGGGIGATVERRWPNGLGAFGGYDAWFLDSDSVYELGVQQALRGGLRYTLPNDIVLHPVFELSLGITGYGDTFRVATVGVLAQPFAGAEFELSETFGLRAGIGLRAFSHSEFRTERDNIPRGRNGVFSESDSR
jgi:hypothetical protein